jgi:hypothetical protein
MKRLLASIKASVMRGVLALVGGLFLTVGLVFATIAAWQGLVLWNGPIAAALVLSGVYAGLGLILIAVAQSGVRAPAPPPEPQPLARIVEAFVSGFVSGVSARRPAAGSDAAAGAKARRRRRDAA